MTGHNSSSPGTVAAAQRAIMANPLYRDKFGDSPVAAFGLANSALKGASQHAPDVAATPSDQPIPLADHDEIGRKVLGQPWAIQSAIVTIAAHCTVIKDKCEDGDIAAASDLAGCISQDLLDLANFLSRAPAQATPEPSAWRVCWVSLNTARTELFEDAAKAYAKANETGGGVTPLFTGPVQAPARLGVQNEADIRTALMDCADILEDSRSNHVAGSKADEDWDKRRANLLAGIATALSSANRGGDNG